MSIVNLTQIVTRAFMLHGGFLQSYVIGIEAQFTWLGDQCSSN
jgi:hypothetical protein